MKVKLTVLSCKGKCSQGHKPGDSWLMENKTAGGICFSAFCSLLPWIQALRFDAQMPWDVEVACPDPENQVVIKVEKVV